MNRELLFPTPIWQKDFPNSKKLNKHLFKHIKAWAREEPGVEKTNAGKGWHSATTMATNPEYNDLCQELFTMVKAIFKDYGLEMPFFLGNMWANINYPGAYNKIHLHPNSTLSGAYYVKVPKDSGCLILRDPRTIIKDDQSAEPDRHMTILPEEVLLFLFPGYLEHMVTPSESDESRISIAFNVYIYDDK